MDIRTQATLLAAVVSAALAGAALLRAGGRRAFGLFAAFAANLALLSVAELARAWPVAEVTGPAPGLRLSIAAAALLPASALAFFLEFLGVARRPARRARNAMLAGSLGGLAVAASPLAHARPARLAVAAYALAGLAAVLPVLLHQLRAAPTRAERGRLRWLLAGAALALLLRGLDGLPRVGVAWPIAGAGAVALTVFAFFLWNALLLHRLLDLHELLGKLAVAVALAVALAAVYGGLVAWVGDRPGLFTFNTLVASAVVLALVDPLRDRVEGWVARTLFRERHRLVVALGELRERVASAIEPAELATALLDGLVETRRVTHASLWVVAEDRPGFRLLASRGPPPEGFLEPASARALLAAAGAGGRAALLENLERRRAELAAAGPDDEAAAREERARIEAARGAMAAMRAGVALPLVAGDRAVGFLALADDRVPEAFASNEIAACIELAERVARGLDNSQLYLRMKERDRLAALGEMAAGLAHEIRNPLAAIQGALQLLAPAAPGAAAADGPDAFLAIIADEVRRLDGVVSGFLDYARPARAALAPVDVNELLRRTFALLGPGLPASVALRVDLAPGLPPVAADAERLRQVFLNLALNAVQAMPAGGELRVETRLARDDVAPWRAAPLRDERVEVRFRDTGPGIPEEAREHLFVPFYTTKEKGTGLGLAVSQRIVTSHGGTLRVRSAPGEGAELVVALPALAAGAAEPGRVAPLAGAC